MAQTRSTRRAAVRDLKRSLILEAARTVFEREGLERASMRAIAEAAGYTAAAIYFHFPGKEAIYGALLEESLDRLGAAVAESVAAAPSPAARLTACGLAFFDYYAAHPRDLDLGFYLFRGGMRPRGLEPGLNRALNEKLRAALAPVGEAVAALGGDATRAAEVTADVFAHASGLLLLAQTRRLRLFGAEARPLMAAHLDRLVGDLGAG